MKHGIGWTTLVFSSVLVSGLALAAPASEKPGCRVEEKTYYVNGLSMAEVFKPESPLTAEMGYYACHEPQRDEFVLVEITGRKRMILKQLRAVPGDRLALEKMKSGGVRLKVNDRFLKTPKGKYFEFSEKRSKMLALYIQQFQGKMPDGLYFVFGTEAQGSLDSSQFGPVTHAQLMARVRDPKKKK